MEAWQATPSSAGYQLGGAGVAGAAAAVRVCVCVCVQAARIVAKLRNENPFNGGDVNAQAQS